MGLEEVLVSLLRQKCYQLMVGPARGKPHMSIETEVHQRQLVITVSDVNNPSAALESCSPGSSESDSVTMEQSGALPVDKLCVNAKL